MGTFGTLTDGTWGSGLEDAVYGGQYACPEACIADSITAWLGNTTAAKLVKCKIYDTAGNTIGETEEKLVPIQAATEVIFSFDEPKPELSAQNYILAAFGASGEGSLTIRATGGGTDKYKIGLSYPTWPADPVAFSSIGDLISIYCTYTAGGGAAPLYSGGFAASNRFDRRGWK